MPLFMDLHIIPGANPEDVAKAHIKDLYCQDEFGCRAITYWFDQCRGKAFCLIEAPNAEAVTELHRKAHGLVPNQVTLVDPSLVESFLGRLTDPDIPQPALQDSLKVFEDSALRYLVRVSLPDFVLLKAMQPGENVPELQVYSFRTIEQLAAEYRARRVVSDHDTLDYAFKSSRDALEFISKLEPVLKERSALLDAGASVIAGEPLTDMSGFFEEAMELLQALNYFSRKQKVVVGSEVLSIGDEYKDVLKQTYNSRLVFIDRSNEDFLAELNSLIAGCYVNPDLDVGQLASNLAFSHSKLYRECKRVTGVSPNRFIREYRLHRAKKLLANSRESITEVGFQCGFNTPSYFTRCFSQFFGINPADYKNEMAVMNEMLQ